MLAGDASSFRDARRLVITDAQFNAFLGRHKNQSCLVSESNETMKDSYLEMNQGVRRATPRCRVVPLFILRLAWVSGLSGWREQTWLILIGGWDPEW